MSAVLPCAELVAPVANMLAAAVAAGRVGVPSRPAPSGAAAGDPPAETSQEVSGEGRGQGGGPARQPDRADLHSAVDDGPGPGAHRVDGPAVCAGRGGRPAGLAGRLHRCHRRRPGCFRPVSAARRGAGRSRVHRGPGRGVAVATGWSPRSWRHRPAQGLGPGLMRAHPVAGSIDRADDPPVQPADPGIAAVLLGWTVTLGTYGARTMSGITICLLYTSPSPRDRTRSRMPSSA